MKLPIRPERATQNRIIALFTAPDRPDSLGYRYLGDWSDRENHPIEEAILTDNLVKRGYPTAVVSAALLKLRRVVDAAPGASLYQVNMDVYQLLRYGVQVSVAAGKPNQTVHLIDWDRPDSNDFALAEEVTLRGGHERRPDIVLYINGIPVAVMELKRGSAEVGDGVRQLVSNQEAMFNQQFFSAVQLLLAGNDSQGLRYGTTGTPEKLFLEWKSGATNAAVGDNLDRPLAELCEKRRLLDIIRNFVIFDAGTKKIPRKHQYEGIKAAQAKLAKKEGGVIWHTQGSGKSILMVLLAKWLLEHDPDARVLIVTDRDELDRQIDGVMRNTGVSGETSSRIQSRAELVQKLGASTPRLLCALIHKINPSDLQGEKPRIAGQFYVFVDECHRTQGGAMNRQMKRWLDSAIFVGFTGTPLLRADRKATREVFGAYIHTYKFQQAVADRVILDLKYEARDIPQRLSSEQAVDDWFAAKTKGLNNYRKAVLRERWATMRELMSSEGRKGKIIVGIIQDFAVKPRLNSDRGTAILVVESIYDACHYFRLFQNTPFGKHCGLVTSYEPTAASVSREPLEGDEKYKYDTYTDYVLHGRTTLQYENEVRRLFQEEPARMKLLIVVDKLLTGFDAPSCTYIYLDKTIRDHNLFQAICRTNRLDGDDKDFGYIVDYQQLFHHLQNAVSVYTSDELDTDESGETGNPEIGDWLRVGREKLDKAREELKHLCEPVAPPQELERYLAYFCGDAANPNALSDTEPLRIAFYKATAGFFRAYAAISGNLAEAGYSPSDIAAMEKETVFFAEIRAAVKRHSGEVFDIKPFESDMRHFINTHIQANPSTSLGDTGSLTDAIVATGINNAIARKLNRQGKLSNRGVADAIINNVRKEIVRLSLADPRFYAEMSKLLDDLIIQSRAAAFNYRKFLREAEALIQKLKVGKSPAGVPAELVGRTEAIVLFHNLPDIKGDSFRRSDDEAERVKLALALDRAMRNDVPAGWKGNATRENEVRNILHPLMGKDAKATEAVFDLIKNQSGYQ
ncbi:MAG: HsdR family type I site-specific deoxyribonuclease [Planctomycetota bacterium]|jgi:type I restriction enzyme R subunit|nr:HsdR family type I site-specific deoxyribonuclease [Planctomycetota bacterium]